MKKILFLLLFPVLTSAQTATQFGIICGSCDDKTQAAKIVGVNWLRIQVALKGYKGDNVLKKYYDAGLNMIVTIKWASGVDTFLTDTTRYKAQLDKFIQRNRIAGKELFLVIANEETNRTNNYGTAQDYVNLLNAAVSVASKYNLSISNGGLTFSILKLKIFVDMMDKHSWDAAYKFAATCVPKETITHLQNPAYNNWHDIKFLDSVVNGISKIDYINFYTNFHYYAPAYYQRTPKAAVVDSIISDKISILSTATLWLSANTYHKVICNEMGQLNSSPKLVQSMLRNAVKLNIPVLIWKSGDDGDSYGLFDNNMVLRENGKAFTKFVKANQ